MTPTATFRGIPLVGRRFGRLTVTRCLGHERGMKKAFWECSCDCGQVTRVRGDNLKGGGTRSCGCLVREPASHPDKRQYALVLVPSGSPTLSKGVRDSQHPSRSGAIVVHEVDGSRIGQRSTDGYVNATAMCNAAGKMFNDYSRLKQTKEFLFELSASTGIPVDELCVVLSGVRNEMRGTWVHPHVAMNLAQWCSPKFAVSVAIWVTEWMLSGQQLPRPRKQPAAAAELGWTETREDGKGPRKDLCRVLAAGGIHNPADFRNATADVSREVLGASPSEIRRARKVPKSDPLRDHLTKSENLALAFAEDVAVTQIVETGATGVAAIQCAVSVAVSVGRLRKVKKQLVLQPPVSEESGKSAFRRMKAMLGKSA